jgi:hypothetical protein
MIRYYLTKVHISWIVVILNKVSPEKQTADPANPTPTVFKYHYGGKRCGPECGYLFSNSFNESKTVQLV